MPSDFIFLSLSWSYGEIETVDSIDKEFPNWEFPSLPNFLLQLLKGAIIFD